MERKQNNNYLLREIQDDLRKLKTDTAQIKLDLKVILAKLQEKKDQEKKQEADAWWWYSVGR